MAAVVVFSTFPNVAKAHEIARVLVDEKLAACVNVHDELVRSFYFWDGKLEDSAEALAIIKTTSERLDELTARLVALHPYQLPEVIALPVVGGSAAYLDWVRRETTR